MGVLKTNLVGKKVCHKFIGEGVIRKQIVRNDQSTDIIEVEFPNGESKKFNYPTIFLNFLAMSDENDNAIVQKDIAEYNKIIAINKPSPTISNSGSGLESTAAGSAKSNREPRTGTRKKDHYQSKNIAFK